MVAITAAMNVIQRNGTGSGSQRDHHLIRKAMMDNSFLLSNMAPHLGNFNQKIWMRLETHVNKWAEGTGVNVITGAIFDRDDGRAR